MIALCLGAAAALALGVLRPGPQPGREVVVVARTIGAGSVITADDLTTRALPPDALPAAGLAGPEVVGSRAAIGLEEGTVLTVSMTSAALAAGLEADERLVQVPVEVGAQLAEPGPMWTSSARRRGERRVRGIRGMRNPPTPTAAKRSAEPRAPPFCAGTRA